MLQIGSVLDGKYKILNEIGHGGMSVVYLALNERANKTWAVKEVRKDGGNDSEVVSQGLIAETEMLKKLNHPNLPSIVDVIDTEDTFIIVMDYIEGRSLQSVLNHTGAQDPERVLEWSKQLCDVLGYLHSRQPAIIYRDMKPANVMLRPDGQVALIDFGTAREYKEHSQGDTTWLGTRGYAAPEQFGGRGQTDARTDIYCLGATMYHLLTGYSPADTQFVIYPLGQLIPSLAGSGLEKVVAKCCEPEPSNRYQSCAELMYALEHVHDEDTKAIKERNKKWRMFIASCILAIVGIVGMAGFKITETATTTSRQEEQIRAASNALTYEEKADHLGRAISIRPGNKQAQEAFNALLEYAVAADDEGRRVITGPEDQAINKVVTTTAVGSKSQNITEFSKRNHKAYLEFQYKRVTYYMDMFNGNMQNTKDFADELANDEDLDQNRRDISECMSMLCELRAANNEGVDLSESDFSQDDRTFSEDSKKKDVYASIWGKFESIAGNSNKIDDKTHGRGVSITIYKEIARQIADHQSEYENAGITNDQMSRLLEAAEQYLKNNTHDAEYGDRAVAALDEVEAAFSQLNQTHKTDLGAGSAPSSEKTDNDSQGGSNG